MAISRLILDNFQNIKAQWGRLGIDVAQLALAFGANDLEGSISNDKNSQLSGARPFRSMNRAEIDSLIAKAGFIPTERDGYYQAIKAPPPCQDHHDSHVSRLLYTAEKGHILDEAEAVILAKYAPLTSLGYCAQVHKSQQLTIDQVSFVADAWELEPLFYDTTQFPHVPLTLDAPQASLDLGLVLTKNPNLSWTQVVETLFELYKIHPEVKVAIKGIKALLLLARKNGLKLASALSTLRQLQVNMIESSSYS